MIPKIILKPQREKSILRRHPWIFSGAITEIRGSPSLGETIQILSSDHNFLCWAAYSPHSQISARVWGWEESEVVDYSFFFNKINRAIKLRENISKYANAYRLVYAESDGLPGLIVDRYADFLVVQFLSAGAEFWKDTVIDICMELTGISDIIERSDVDVRKLEGLEERRGVVSGKRPPEILEIYENSYKYYVELLTGHKTGFYLDQKENRIKISKYSKDKAVLDCFSYTGGFAIPALKNNAKSVTCIDSSKIILDIARKNIELNSLPIERVKFIEGNVFHELRKMRDHNSFYELIILDPPKFAPTKGSIVRASRGYKDINLLALKLLNPGGFLVTFSCSGSISESLFQKILADAAVDAGVQAVIIDRLTQASDHPIALNFPEGAYLKGFVIYKVS